jgi:ferrochelatase
VLGQKHASPFVEDAAEALAGDGLTTIVGLVLAPHYSGASVGEYQRRLADAAAARGATAVPIERWALLPEYVTFLAGALVEARATLPAEHKVLFTAHSLPERVLVGDPYPDELRASAAAVAERCQLPRWAGWSMAWQSAGATPEPWRGPDVLEVIRELGATGRATGVCVCPQGFVSDHLEVLYDLDVEAARVAAEHGLSFARTRVLNDDPTVFGALADRVLELAAAA